MADNTATATASQLADINQIQSLLKTKDDTQRFVGLALLKFVLDGSEQLRQDEQTVQSLWSSLSPKFLDRLLRTGSNPSTKNSNELLDLVVSVLHIFSILLPDQARCDAKFIDRIPLLVSAVLYRYRHQNTYTIIRHWLYALALTIQPSWYFSCCIPWSVLNKEHKHSSRYRTLVPLQKLHLAIHRFSTSSLLPGLILPHAFKTTLHWPDKSTIQSKAWSHPSLELTQSLSLSFLATFSATPAPPYVTSDT